MLENTVYQLTKAKKLNIVYFGGSITEGAGASSYEKCWAAKTSDWFKEQYPDSEIVSYNAAVGGTGSLLGVYRCDMDVLSRNPDLVFFEFAMNDFGCSFDESAVNADAIFRKIWMHNPYADIILLFTCTMAASDKYASGKIIESRIAQSTVALYYGGVPQIDIGDSLRFRVLTEGNDWKKYTCDTVHPTDDGYAICTETICRNLREIIDRAKPVDAPVKKELKPPYVTNNSRFSAVMVDAFKAELGKGFRQCPDTPFFHLYPHYIEATEPGAELTFRFTGTSVGIYVMFAKDSGDITYSVDDDPAVTIRPWDRYCLQFNRACGCLLARTLPYGEHTLKMRVAESKEERSEGHAVRIATFMVM